MKPLQADWLMKWCTELTDPEAQRIVPSVWGETGITKALSDGSNYFLSVVKSF